MKKTIATLALLASAAGGVHAQAYVAGAAGPSHANFDCAGTTSCDNGGTGFKLIGGYKVNPNIGLELSYLDFGEAKATVFDPFFGSINGKITTQGVGLGIAVFGDLTRKVYGVARLGLASLETKIKASVGGASGSVSESKTQPYFGLGVGYRFTEQFSAEAAADFSRTEFDGEKANVRMLTVGLAFRF